MNLLHQDKFRMEKQTSIIVIVVLDNSIEACKCNSCPMKKDFRMNSIYVCLNADHVITFIQGEVFNSVRINSELVILRRAIRSKNNNL